MSHPYIILDANAFITGSGLTELGATYKFVTTSAVMDQLRDVKTRDLVDKFLFDIQEMEPAKKSVQFVREFAKKTGDLASLSDVDVQLLALAHTLYINKGLEQKLRKNPPPLKQYQSKQSSSEQQEQQIKQKHSSEDDQQPTQPHPQTTEKQHQNPSEQPLQPQQPQPQPQSQQNQPKQENAEDDDDDGWIVVPKSKPKKKQQSDDDLGEDEGWVTPKNFDRKMAEGLPHFGNNQSEDEEEEVPSCGVSLMTADFAMQNVAIQMGIQLKSLDGRLIREIRRFILECYLCWKTYKVEDNVVKLCKECGYNSLSKIAYSLTPNGEMILHRKKGWKPNKKVLEWKQRKFEEQQKKKKHQHARRKKEASIFDA